MRTASSAAIALTYTGYQLVDNLINYGRLR